MKILSDFVFLIYFEKGFISIVSLESKIVLKFWHNYYMALKIHNNSHNVKINC
jgi:hypothetical protein